MESRFGLNQTKFLALAERFFIKTKRQIKMIGEKLSPILEEIENALWEFEIDGGGKYQFTTEGLRATTKIFMATLLDKMWELNESENFTIEERVRMAEKLGGDVRKLIKTYTDIDSHDFYKK